MFEGSAAGLFTLQDFLDQMKMIRKMGSLKDLLKMVPGLGNMFASNPDGDADAEMGRLEAVINSMTPFERAHPDEIDCGRQHRIARGAGTDAAEVERLLDDFRQMAAMARKMSGMRLRGPKRAPDEGGMGGMSHWSEW